MNYRRLGRSGLKVSELSFGSWVTYGNQLGADSRARMHGRGLRCGRQLLRQRRGLRQGRVGNDHGRGAASSLGWRRSSYIVSTKFYWGLHDGPNEKNTLNRKYLMQAIDGSLARLRARLRRPRVLPPPRSGHADRGDGARDARHDRRGQGALLGHVGVDRGGDRRRRGTSPNATPAQAGDGAAAVQPAAPRSGREGVRAAVRATSGSAPRSGARSPRACSPASTTTASRRSRAARSRATSGSPSGSPSRRSSRWCAASRRSRADLGCTLAQMSLAWCLEEPARVDGDHRREPRAQVHENMKALDVVPRLDAEVMARIDAALAAGPHAPVRAA